MGEMRFSYVNDPTNWNTENIEVAFVCATQEDAKKAEALFSGLLDDARRYRWLKENHLQTGPDSWIRTGDDLEDAIDAALRES